MELKREFIESLEALLPGGEAGRLVQALSGTEPSVAVRINPAKASTNELQGETVPWCPEGRYLAQREPFTFDTDFQSGRYYVQDASSMFITHVIRQLVQQPVRYLDLCAAPGGKTTAALSALPAGSLMVTNEVVPQRAQVLRENVIKWGCPSCVVSSSQPKDFGRNLPGFFDVIATDVPCSGEGMMRKDDTAVSQWTPQLPLQCAALQRSIVADVWPALKPGGLLIYSTCTFNREEDELMVQHIISELGAEPVAVEIDPSWHIHPAIGLDAPCYRFLPHLTRGEGLFVAVLRKPAGATVGKLKKQKAKTTALPRQIGNWLLQSDDYVMTDDYVALPASMATDMLLLRARLKVLHMGVPLGEAKGKRLVPSHALALSQALNQEAFTRCEVDYKTAMAYLHGEAVSLPGAPRGYVLLTHHGHPIGFANNLGNRANNLYPKPWRILSTHLPDAEPSVLKH